MKFCQFLMFSNSILFMMLKHPLSLGFSLLIQTICISLLTGLMNLTFWFSYIVFLVMIGGMLILFIYMTSVAANKKFKLSLINSLIMVPIFFSFNFLFTKISAKNMEMLYNNSHLEINLFNFKYLNTPLMNLSIFMFIYLLVVLIMSVKMTNFKKGPIRQKN